VDEVVGMQHFAQDALLANAAPGAPFIQGHFDGDPSWQVFSPFALAQTPGFMDVAP
jgi:twitching motility protein PilI